MTHGRLPRAPTTDQTLLADPALDHLPAMLDANAAQMTGWQYDFQGRPAATLRAETRDEMLRLALRYTRQFCDVPASCSDRLSAAPQIIAAGHQPELFHPGVWVKNFAIARVAATSGRVALNLMVDNDTVKGTAVRVPTGSLDRPTIVHLPFDRWRGELPHEAYEVADESLFASFGDRLVAAVRELGIDPLVRSLWSRVRSVARQTRRLGERIAWARRQIEADWGAHLLELPIRLLCQSTGFAWFAVHVLAQLPRFQQCYNTALADYRRAARMRSHDHPVPDLERDGDWLEAPFWVWHADSPRRRQLFARRVGQRLELTDRDRWTASIPLAGDADGAAAVAALAQLQASGLRLRTRALTTTLVTRLLVADGFVHGMGGARYDMVANDIMEQFFSVTPPGFATLTATVHLPVRKPAATRDDVRSCRRLLRDLRYQPERFVDAAAPGPLVAEKADWVRQQLASRAQRHRRFVRIRELNALLAAQVESRRQETERRLADLETQLQFRDILASREYPFCVYPADLLRDFYRRVTG